MTVLRDWNSGKIPFFTSPPTIHPSSAPAPPTLQSDVDMGDMSEGVGDARILNTLSEAFTLEGLYDIGDNAPAWEGEEALEQEAMVEE